MSEDADYYLWYCSESTMYVYSTSRRNVPTGISVQRDEKNDGKYVVTNNQGDAVVLYASRALLPPGKLRPAKPGTLA